jgi:Ca2+-binding RTX toxin-like protein
MSTLIAYDDMGSGLNMSATTTGGGFLVNDSSITTTYLGAIDADTIAYSVSNAGLVKYFLVSGSVNIYTGDAILTELIYGNAAANPLISWTDVNLYLNLFDDFSAGINYSILNSSDYIYGNKYADIIKSGSGNDFVFGRAGNDYLYGESGNDSLYGGVGNDLLYGGSNTDKFFFDTTLSASANVDTIKDFVKGTDKIVLDDDIFTKFTNKSSISAGNLITGTKALQADDYLIYSTSNDILYYDADGSGSKFGLIAFAKIELVGTSAPSATDFLVIT